MLKLLSGIITATVLASPLPAAAEMVVASDPQSVISALQASGYRAKLDKDGVDDPMITSGTAGANFSILFFGCKEHRSCTTVQFYAGFKNDGSATVSKMNEWNQKSRFGRAYIDQENDPVVEMDLDLDKGGMSRELFENNLEYWTSVVSSFRQHLMTGKE